MRPVRISGVVIAVVIAGSVLLGAAGCGSGPEGEARLTVYLSAPLNGPAAGDGRDIADGARLALEDASESAGGIPIRLVALSDADEQGSNGAMAGANARRATADSTAIAYIGELDSGTTRTSLPITNEAGMLQVSPAASAVNLTREAPGSGQVPSEVQPSGRRTFGRVIPSDTIQGAAAAVWMADERIRHARVIDNGGTYGESLLDGFQSVSDGPLIASAGRVDATYDVASRPSVSRSKTIASPVTFGADAQLTGSPPESALVDQARIVSGALDPSQLPSAADQFPSDFESAHGREPGRFAAYGYEAMAVVLDSIGRAGEPLDRGSVIDAFFATTERDSILGTYSIDEVGDTTLDQVGAYESDAGGLRAAPRPLTVP